MTNLLLSILFSTGMFLFFRLAALNNLSGIAFITVNYIVAALFAAAGLIIPDKSFVCSVNPKFFLIAAILGVLFVIMFYIMSLSVAKVGMGISSAASKISVIFPFFFSILIDPADTLSLKMLIGMFIILLSILFITLSNNAEKNKNRFSFIPLLLFFGIGIIDSFLKFSQQYFIPDPQVPFFSVLVFIMCASITLIVFIKGKGFKPYGKKIKIKALVIGTALGTCNYFAFYFFLRALNTPTLGSSKIFAFYNIGIILLSSLIGLLVFKEKLSRLNWIGIGLSLCGIFFLI